MNVAMQKDEIGKLLERLGTALSSNDLPAAALCFAAPAFIVSENGATVLENAWQTEQMFTKAADWYHSQGLVSTKAEVEHFEQLSDAIGAIDVRWPSFDKAGTEKFSERSHYILQTGADGKPLIRVALTRTK